MTNLSALAHRALEIAGEKNLCTAGKLAALLSEAPGAAERLTAASSPIRTRPARSASRPVSSKTRARSVAMSRPRLAHGALTRSPADVAVSITGVAGPDPDENGNPVGRVCIGLARAGTTRGLEYNYGKLEREAVQARAMTDALTLLVAMLEEC
jgi:nicotinamide-nucleotide amidase